MLTYKNILVPTDFSPNASIAVEQALALAREGGGRVHLFHVLETSLFGPTYIPQGGYVLPRAKEEVFTRLEAVKTAHPEVEIVTAAALGIPADEIVAYAEAQDIDLICISTVGRRGLSRALLGSTTEAVVRRASCPVLSLHRPRAVHEQPAPTVAPATHASPAVRAEASAPTEMD